MLHCQRTNALIDIVNNMLIGIIVVDRKHVRKSFFFFFNLVLEGNFSNLFYIFLLDLNFENLTIELHVFIIFSILVKFQEVKRSKAMLSIKYLKFKFL